LTYQSEIIRRFSSFISIATVFELASAEVLKGMTPLYRLGRLRLELFGFSLASRTMAADLPARATGISVALKGQERERSCLNSVAAKVSVIAHRSGQYADSPWRIGDDGVSANENALHLLGFYNPSNKIAFFFGGSAEDWELIKSDMTYAFSGGCPALIHDPHPEDIVCEIDHFQIFRITMNRSRSLNNYG
jgi:hypothetical protein